MAKLLGTYDDRAAAETVAARLQAGGVPPSCWRIVGGAAAPLASSWKTPLLWGGIAGAAAACFWPTSGHLLQAGHWATAVAAHKLTVTTKALVSGAAAGGTLSWLRRAGLRSPALKEAEAAVAAGRYALVVHGDWRTQQRAARVLEQIPRSAQAQRETQRLLALVQRYGWEHQSFLSLYDDMKVWWTDDPEAAVVYRQVGQVAIVVAAPLAPCAAWQAVTYRFLFWCEQQGLDCLMLPVGEAFAAVARDCGMALLQIGETGYFKLPEWKPAGDRAKKVRAGVNQARKAGVRIESFAPDQASSAFRDEVEALCQSWLETREVDALGWLLELDPFKFSAQKRYFLAREASGRIVGLLACAPMYARQGWYLEDLLRHAQAPRGVSELLVVEALQQLGANDAALATLATSPLAGIDPATANDNFQSLARCLNLIYEHLETFYHFKSLHRFKAKFAPSYVEADYVAIYPPRVRWRMLTALLKAFEPDGLSGLLTAKLERWWQHYKATKEQITE